MTDRLLLCLMVIVLLKQAYFAFPMKNAGEKLANLRVKMTEKSLDAYVIPSEDEHQSEYIAEYDERRKWISGFTGSAGTAVITKTKAALWTDSRYWLRAEKELDKNFWTLKKSGIDESIDDFLRAELNENSTVGMNARLFSKASWESRENALKDKKISLNNPQTDLIDEIWKDRPAKPNTEIIVHTIEYCGKSWQDKIKEVLDRMKNVANIFVITALDEVAWLFNLRASDIPYNPMFFAYAIVSDDGNHVLYIDPSRITNNIKIHLNGIKINDYNQVFNDISQFSSQNKTIWISPMSSYAIYNAVTNKNLLVNNKASPVRSLKSVKNPTEIRRAKECQLRDSITRIRHMYWLEQEMNKQNPQLTEISVAKKLEEMQSKDQAYKSLSFDSISAVGPNAADIHYSPDPVANVTLKKNQMYMLDAGAQYLDCTTDITRTHHFGTPTEREIMAYTMVLKGSIDLARAYFPSGLVYARDIDALARSALWSVGLDYGHGTGHGIGYYANIHEDPPYGGSTYDEPYVAGMFQSDEPGYYEDGNFGIRLETDIVTVEAKTDYNFRGRKYLKFEAQSLVPFERKLIDVKLLTKAQIDWLNEYNEQIRKSTETELKKEPDLWNYLLLKTEKIVSDETTTIKPVTTTKDDSNNFQTTTSSSTKVYTSFVSLFLATIISFSI